MMQAIHIEIGYRQGDGWVSRRVPTGEYRPGEGPGTDWSLLGPDAVAQRIFDQLLALGLGAICGIVRFSVPA